MHCGLDSGACHMGRWWLSESNTFPMWYVWTIWRPKKQLVNWQQKTVETLSETSFNATLVIVCGRSGKVWPGGVGKKALSSGRIRPYIPSQFVNDDKEILALAANGIDLNHILRHFHFHVVISWSPWWSWLWHRLCFLWMLDSGVEIDRKLILSLFLSCCDVFARGRLFAQFSFIGVIIG